MSLVPGSGSSSDGEVRLCGSSACTLSAHLSSSSASLESSSGASISALADGSVLLSSTSGGMSLESQDLLTLSSNGLSIAGQAVAAPQHITILGSSDSSDTQSSHISVVSGTSDAGISGNVVIAAGSTNSGAAGNIILLPGSASSGTAGSFFVGDSDVSNGGIRALFSKVIAAPFSGSLAASTSMTGSLPATEFSSSLSLADDQFVCFASWTDDVALTSVFLSCQVSASEVRLAAFNLAGTASADLSTKSVAVVLLRVAG